MKIPLVTEAVRRLWTKVYESPLDLEFWGRVKIPLLRGYLTNKSPTFDHPGSQKIALFKFPFLKGPYVQVTDKNFKKVTKLRGTETTKWVFVTKMGVRKRQLIWIPSGPRYKDALHCAAHVLGVKEDDLDLIQRFG